MATTYYRFRVDGKLEGLARRRESAELGSIFARVAGGAWVVDQAIFRYLAEPSDIELVKVSEDEAQTVADSYEVEL